MAVCSKRTACVAALVAGLTLHGCGGGDGGGGGGDEPQKVTGTTTTGDPCLGKYVEPTGNALIDKLNQDYIGFDAASPASPKGVTMRMADTFEVFCGTPCHSGYPDCRMSASLYNNKMLLTENGRHIMITMERAAGIIFNQKAVESTIGKCAYMYDAQTFSRVNRGCGCAATHTGCGDMDSAYWSQECEYEHPDQHSGVKKETCKNDTETSPDVGQCWCNTKNLRDTTPTAEEAQVTDQQCFFKLPALVPEGGVANELHEMVKARVQNQENTKLDDFNNGAKKTDWNEVVIDAEPMEKLLFSDPSSVVVAFMYVKSFGLAGRQLAQGMSLEAKNRYGASIPIVEVDDKGTDIQCAGPFKEANDLPTTTTTTPRTTLPDGLVGPMGQCGGQNWKGNTQCVEGYHCVEQNHWYFFCDAGAPTTTTAPSKGPSEGPPLAGPSSTASTDLII